MKPMKWYEKVWEKIKGMTETSFMLGLFFVVTLGLMLLATCWLWGPAIIIIIVLKLCGAF